MADTFQPILFCFCGPTAVGKSTISRELVANDPSLLLSISTTTRQPRPGEKDGVEYFFVTTEEFEKRVQQGKFFEHAEFSGNRYGTEQRNVELARGQKKDLILDIEVQGVTQLKRMYPNDVVTTFVFPPSFHELRQRLTKRGSENAEQIKVRLDTAQRELATLRQPGFSDYLIVNDDLPRGLAQAQCIVTSSRLKFNRFSASFLDKLLTDTP